MAVNTTRWTPDTCGCVIEYSWDSAVAQSSRVHTPSNVVARCPGHSALTDISAHFNALMDENPRKNKFLEYLRSNYSVLTTTDTGGNIILKAGIVTWSFDANRVLQVSVPALTATQKTNAQTWVDTNLGAGKAKVS